MTTGDAVLVGRNLSKRYLRGMTRSGVLGRRRAAPVEHWAVRDIDLEVRPEEVLAVIGRNGAGKSTLLKIAAGVTTPTEGTVRRPIRIAPLIEVGAGFHPELTGRENVEVNARLLGLTPREIRSTFDSIVEFSGLEASIDQPVRQYSSGMFMRLGFSVAVHTDPELLIVDEVLAVGDLPFQVRCLDRIEELRAGGAGVLFVSHNLGSVLNIANRVLLLDDGEMVTEGDPNVVVGAYHDLVSAQAQELSSKSWQLGEEGVREPDDLELLSVQMTHADGHERPVWEPGDEVLLTTRLRARTDTPEGMPGIRLSKDGLGFVGGYRAEEDARIPPLSVGDVVETRMRLRLSVAQGTYTLDVGVVRPDWTHFLMVRRGVLTFGVNVHKGATGIVDLEARLESVEVVS